jgi:hypothetical protein
VHGSRFAVLVVRRLVRRLRAHWPDIAIEIRADSGFAIPRMYAWCEANGVGYTIGLVPNPVLERLAEPLTEQAQAQSTLLEGGKVRVADEHWYQAGSWPTPRRAVYKAEILEQGPNTRFVVTTRPDPPMARYDWYVDRGQSENWIKDDKNALAADRLSDHRFWANQFRLLLHAAACWLATTEAARFQFDTLRLRLVKIGAKVRECVGFVWLHLASSHPSQPLWHHLAIRRRSP